MSTTAVALTSPQTYLENWTRQRMAHRPAAPTLHRKYPTLGNSAVAWQSVFPNLVAGSFVNKHHRRLVSYMLPLPNPIRVTVLWQSPESPSATGNISQLVSVPFSLMEFFTGGFFINVVPHRLCANNTCEVFQLAGAAPAGGFSGKIFIRPCSLAFDLLK